MERKQGTYQKEFRVMTIISSANKDSFASFFPIGCPLFLFLDLLDWLGPPVNVLPPTVGRELSNTSLLSIF